MAEGTKKWVLCHAAGRSVSPDTFMQGHLLTTIQSPTQVSFVPGALLPEQPTARSDVQTFSYQLSSLAKDEPSHMLFHVGLGKQGTICSEQHTVGMEKADFPSNCSEKNKGDKANGIKNVNNWQIWLRWAE